jgi:hypothetical protein
VALAHRGNVHRLGAALTVAHRDVGQAGAAAVASAHGQHQRGQTVRNGGGGERQAVGKVDGETGRRRAIHLNCHRAGHGAAPAQIVAA